MSFEVGRLSAALTLDGVPEFHSQLDAAGRKLTDTGQKGASFGKLGEQAVRSAAGATTGLVAAAGAYLTILTKQGVAYNSMQQNSRAALKVLLGGTEAANVQMAKLDDFARNSPFSKSVFIQAQQQLIGFGMEAGKVVPTLDAIQQGVAAMGGSNEQISEVVNILANVQSTGKITAETLNQLGYRGIDAATLMGDAMGKTAAQMREDISKGAIGGAEAIDVLVDAMQNRFGGAADGVKEQWSGATDRIKAASRDIGAHIAEPFISAQGGGMAVTWGNQVADVLRGIEKQAVPVMSILTQRGMPFFASLTQGLDSTAQAIKRWNPESFSVTLDKLANHAPGIAALAGATLALGTQVGPLGTLFKTLGLSANPVLAAIVGLAAASPELREAFMGVLKAGEPLLPVIGDLAQVLSGTLNSAIPVVSGGLELVAGVLETVLGVVAKIPTPVLMGAAAFLAMHAASKTLAGPLSTVMGLLQGFGQRAALQAALGNTNIAMGALATTSMTAKTGVQQLGGALKTAFLSNPIGIALTVVATAVGAWAMANAAAQQKVEDHKNRVAALRDTLNETTGAITEATEAQVKGNIAETRAAELADQMGIKYKDIEEAILGNADAQERVSAGMTKHWEENAVTLNEADDALNTWSASAMNARNRNSELSDIMTEQKAAIDEARQATIERAQAEREAAAAMGETGRNSQKLKDALQVASDASRDAEERLNALRQALDLLNGGSKSAAEAELEHAKQMTNLKDALGQTVGESGKLVDILNESGGALDLQSTEAQRLGDVLVGLNKSTEAQAMAASDAKIATGDYAGAYEAAQQAMKSGRDAFLEQAEALGLNSEAAEALADKYYSIPDQVATVLSMEGATDASALLALMLSQLSQLEVNDTIELPVDAPGAEETKEALEALGYVVTDTPDGKNYVITSQGKEQALEDLNSIATYQVPEKLFQIDANDADAYAKLEGVNVKQIDEKTAIVWGENADAVKKIQAVIDKNPEKKVVTIDGDDTNFNTVWQGVVGRVGEAWVSIFGKKGNMAGGMYGSEGQHFAAGGFPSGMYQGVNGGIHKQGIDGTPHVFAEAEMGVPWEAYISGKPEFRERNIALALEALRRLGVQTEQFDRLAFPTVPANRVYGTRAFAMGDVLARNPAAMSTPAKTVATPARSEAALVENLYLGAGVTRDELAELERKLDVINRGGL
ncbi:tape measure protein [Leucobacter sp. HY1910]